MRNFAAAGDRENSESIFVLEISAAVAMKWKMRCHYLHSATGNSASKKSLQSGTPSGKCVEKLLILVDASAPPSGHVRAAR
jgi:hypothetical protein